MFLCGTLCLLAIISLGMWELVAVLKVSSLCHVAVMVLCLLHTVSWVGLQYVIVAFPDHTDLLFEVYRLFICKLEEDNDSQPSLLKKLILWKFTGKRQTV